MRFRRRQCSSLVCTKQKVLGELCPLLMWHHSSVDPINIPSNDKARFFSLVFLSFLLIEPKNRRNSKPSYVMGDRGSNEDAENIDSYQLFEKKRLRRKILSSRSSSISVRVPKDGFQKNCWAGNEKLKIRAKGNKKWNSLEKRRKRRKEKKIIHDNNYMETVLGCDSTD